MEFELVEGYRRSKKRGPDQPKPALLYIEPEKCLFIETKKINENTYYTCYQKVLSAKKNSKHLKCRANVTVNANNKCFRNLIKHSLHETHENIYTDLKLLNRIKDACVTSGAHLPLHKVSTKQIFYTEVAKYVYAKCTIQ